VIFLSSVDVAEQSPMGTLRLRLPSVFVALRTQPDPRATITLRVPAIYVKIVRALISATAALPGK
jgi:hypothetical protein